MLDKDAIRSLIRDVIAEEVKHLGEGSAQAAPTSVRIADDADLAGFAREVLRLADDPRIRAAIEAGRHPFQLAGGAPVGDIGASAGPVHRIDKGVVTEAALGKLPTNVTRIQLGPDVSITPLARDRARSRGISIERIGR